MSSAQEKTLQGWLEIGSEEVGERSIRLVPDCKQRPLLSSQSRAGEGSCRANGEGNVAVSGIPDLRSTSSAFSNSLTKLLQSRRGKIISVNEFNHQ
jgi:hypothetical protein